MKLWRRLRGGHWERWWVDSPVNSLIWHRVDHCHHTSRVWRPPTPLCRGVPICEDYPIRDRFFKGGKA